MTSRSYFGKMNSTLGSVVPLAMFYFSPLPPLAPPNQGSYFVTYDTRYIIESKEGFKEIEKENNIF